MSDAPAIVYLEADDEVTSLVRRIRQADASRVIVVAPGRSRATSSAVALRLLARAAESSGHEVAVVGDALTRSLAAEAGLGAYATADDARRAEAVAAQPTAPVQAPIRVMRGADTTTVEPVVSPEEATIPVQVMRPAPSAPRRRIRGGSAVLVGIGAALVIAFVAGAAILPAATVTLEPSTIEVGPVPYVVEVADPDRLGGTVEATATVTATDTYQRLEPATGIVVFRNWTAFDQPVAAGTLVAAGEQAFATQADIIVPRGHLTPQGTIGAGEEAVAVVASAPGPAANVAALAIDTVLNASTDARLRGFRENNERVVLNPDPTGGGLDESGPRISQADVEAAVAALEEGLRAQVGDALAAEQDRIIVQPELNEPTFDEFADLVGTRDEAEVTIRGTLPWEAFSADPAEVIDAATSRLLDDPELAPEGHQLLADSVRVQVADANAEGGVMRVDVTATARAAREVDRAEVLERIAGRTEVEAAAALADLGRASVELWPAWVASVPEAEWRVELRVVSP